MATYIRKLKSADGNWICPATRAEGVYIYTGNITVYDEIESLWTHKKNHDTQISNLQNTVNSKISLSQMYRNGAIYMSTDGTSPASIYGGSWTPINNQFLLGAGAQPAGQTGGAEWITLTASNIPTLSMQIATQPEGYCGANKYPQSFILSSKDPSVVNNDLFDSLNGQTCDRAGGSTYYNSGIVRYYNASPARFDLIQPSYTAYIWERVS